MMSCWAADPTIRPSFHEICPSLSDRMLKDQKLNGLYVPFSRSNEVLSTSVSFRSLHSPSPRPTSPLQIPLTRLSNPSSSLSRSSSSIRTYGSIQDKNQTPKPNVPFFEHLNNTIVDETELEDRLIHNKWTPQGYSWDSDVEASVSNI
jgi:hypothetical protein